MKQLLAVTAICTAIIIFSNCNPAKKATATAPPKSTYEINVQTLVMKDCVPCHVPAKGGRKKAYDNYANVKADIDEIIRRIELNPGDRGFMPFKGNKLNDSTITAWKQWKNEGLLEK
jgi:hypothetical protein